MQTLRPFLTGCALVVVVQVGFLATHDWDPTAMLRVGADSRGLPVFERDFGSVYPVPALGHDGKYFYLVARQPWFWRADADTLAGLHDPPYRYGRPLYPLLAGGFGTLDPWATLAGMLLVQVLAGGVYAAAVVGLARHNGLPRMAIWLGLGNPGVYTSAILLTSDLLALTLILTAVLYCQQGKRRGAIVLAAAAVLAKEYYAIGAFALAGWLFFDGRRRAGVAMAVLPVLPTLVWKGAVTVLLGGKEGASNFTWPGVGILQAVPDWGRLLPVGVFALAVLAATVAGAANGPSPLVRWQCAVWALLGLTASGLVWADPFDLIRVIAPAWWFVIQAWYARPAT